MSKHLEYPYDIARRIANAKFHERKRYIDDSVCLCPVCHGLPRIKYEFIGDGTYCSLECGPWYWKKHLRCSAGVAGINFTRALMHAIANWNRHVAKYYKKHPYRRPPISD